jgi:adenylyltransferase/sulfurtransferase
VILDCTDNPATRYLLSDAAVQLCKPLVSGAAQRFDGQLCTYNLGPDGPCYRCLFPRPPSPEATPSCEETGILGAVTGVIGSLQALEAITIIVGLHGKFCSGVVGADEQPSLLVYAALGVPPFRSIKLRKRRATCPACGTEGDKVGKIEEIDYVQFCGGARPDWETLGLSPRDAESRITASGHHGIEAS